MATNTRAAVARAFNNSDDPVKNEENYRGAVQSAGYTDWKQQMQSMANKQSAAASAQPAAANDPTNQPQAATQEDVNNQDARTRLWQSMNYTYGKQREQSDKAYDQAYSQADRQALSRGMQRSSYNGQTLANINQQKINAQNDIYSAQIADYQNRLTQLDQQEKEDERWEREFAAGREDADWNKKWQEKEAERDQSNRDRDYEFGREQWQAQQDQWREQFDYNKMSDDQKLAYNYVVSILGQGGDPSDDLLARAGLSRDDANAMKTKVSTGGGRSGNNPKPTDKPANTPTDGDVEQDLLEFIDPPDKTGEIGRTYTYLRDEPKYDKFKPTYVK